MNYELASEGSLLSPLYPKQAAFDVFGAISPTPDILLMFNLSEPNQG